LSDIHVDFAYTPGSQGDCSQPLCCRDGQPGEYLVGITTLGMIAVFYIQLQVIQVLVSGKNSLLQ